MTLDEQKVELKSIYDQAVAEGDTETANAAANKAGKLIAAPGLSVYQDASAGLPDAITNMATGMAGKVVGDVAGMAAIPYDYFSRKLGFEGADPETVQRKVASALTYQPRSETGKVISEYNPMAMIGKGVNSASHALGDITEGITGSKRANQLVSDITPELATVLGAKYPISNIPLAKTTGKVASFVPEALMNVARPHINPGLSAGMLMNKIAGERQPAVLNALDDATYKVPSAPGVRQETGISAAQAAVPAGSAEFSALQRAADQIDPSYKIARGNSQELNRDAMLRDVQPDLTNALKVRAATSKPFYDIADASSATINPSMHNMLSSLPTGVISKAENTARIAQTPFTTGQSVPARSVTNPMTNVTTEIPAEYPSITGWNLHNIKTGISDALSNPSLKGTAEGVSNQSLQDFLHQFETQIPAYGAARNAFREKSVPVNQSNVLQKARDILNGQGGTERMAPYMNLTGRGENSFMRSATGYPNAGTVDTVVNPTQMSALDEVSRQLVRDKDLGELANAGSTKVSKVIGDFGKPIDAPTLWNQTATIIKSALGKFENSGRDITMEEVARVMKDPALSARVMRQATPMQKSLISRILNAQQTGSFGAQLGAQNKEAQ